MENNNFDTCEIDRNAVLNNLIRLCSEVDFYNKDIMIEFLDIHLDSMLNIINSTNNKVESIEIKVIYSNNKGMFESGSSYEK